MQLTPPGLCSCCALSLEHPSPLFIQETPTHASKPRPGPVPCGQPPTPALHPPQPPGWHGVCCGAGFSPQDLPPSLFTCPFFPATSVESGPCPKAHILGGKTNPTVLVLLPHFRKPPTHQVCHFLRPQAPAAGCSPGTLSPFQAARIPLWGDGAAVPSGGGTVPPPLIRVCPSFPQP